MPSIQAAAAADMAAILASADVDLTSGTWAQGGSSDTVEGYFFTVSGDLDAGGDLPDQGATLVALHTAFSSIANPGPGDTWTVAGSPEWTVTQATREHGFGVYVLRRSVQRGRA